MREEGVLWELEQARVNRGFVGVDVKPDRGQLSGGQQTDSNASNQRKKRTHMTIFERANHCLLVNNLSPRSIDDDTPALQRSNLFLAYEMHRVGFQRNMYAQYVCFPTERLDAVDVRAPRGGICDTVPVVIDHTHGEGVNEVCEVEADTAEPKNTERARAEVVCVPGRDGGFPRACKERAFGLGKVAEGGEDEV